MPLVLKAVLLYYSPGKIWEHSSISSYYETPRIIATRTSSCNETSRMNNYTSFCTIMDLLIPRQVILQPRGLIDVDNQHERGISNSCNWH